MKATTAAVSAILVTLVLASGAFALSPAGANDITVYVEAGHSQRVDLILQASDSDTGKSISGEGDAGGWIKFGASMDSSYTISNAGTIVVPTYFTAPSDTAVGEYQAYIVSSGSQLYSIKVKVILSPSEISELETQADVNAKLEELKAGLAVTVEEVQTGVTGYIDQKMAEQKTAAQLQAELDAAKQTSQRLEQQNNELAEQRNSAVTGNYLNSGTSVTFALGLLIGAIAAYFYFGRKDTKIRIKRSPESTSL